MTARRQGVSRVHSFIYKKPSRRQLLLLLLLRLDTLCTRLVLLTKQQNPFFPPKDVRYISSISARQAILLRRMNDRLSTTIYIQLLVLLLLRLVLLLRLLLLLYYYCCYFCNTCQFQYHGMEHIRQRQKTSFLKSVSTSRLRNRSKVGSNFNANQSSR